MWIVSDFSWHQQQTCNLLSKPTMKHTGSEYLILKWWIFVRVVLFNKSHVLKVNINRQVKMEASQWRVKHKRSYKWSNLWWCQCFRLKIENADGTVCWCCFAADLWTSCSGWIAPLSGKQIASLLVIITLTLHRLSTKGHSIHIQYLLINTHAHTHTQNPISFIRFDLSPNKAVDVSL